MSEITALRLGTSLISGNTIYLHPAMASRHGIITGATGTGKTRTLQVLVEELSLQGIAVVAPDLKGDISGLSIPGEKNAKVAERLTKLNISTYDVTSLSVQWWRYENTGRGHPLRTSISELGPILLGRILGLNDIQESALRVLFRLADEEGLLLVDSEDLHALLTWAGELPMELRSRVGSLATNTLETIRRKLETNTANLYLGEPALELQDLLGTSRDGYGLVNLIDARDAIVNGKAYALTMVWLLSELFEDLPEVGDVSAPKLVIFIDEAHLLFDDAPQVLLKRIEQVVRLIRSKGVGIFFVSQNVTDIPQPILNQIGTRIHHAVRSYTPADRRSIRALEASVPENPQINVAQEIANLGIGEALFVTLSTDGRPTPVDKVGVAPPRTSMSPLPEGKILELIASSGLGEKYDHSVDPRSAAELLQERMEAIMDKAEREKSESGGGNKNSSNTFTDVVSSTVATALKSAFTSFVRTTANQIGREIMRGILGGVKKR